MSPDAEASRVESQKNVVKRPSRGIVWASLKAGEAVGKPLAEWAHVTPRFPRGIKNSDLRYGDSAIQRETALWWFYLNLEPYDLGKGGPYFGFSGAIGGAPIGSMSVNGAPPNIGGFNQAPLAPPPISALDAIGEEFGGIVAPDLIEELGRALGSRWMWIRPPAQLFAEIQTSSEALSSLLSTLDELAEQLRGLELPVTHGGIGHNQPHGLIPLSAEDRETILQKIDKVKAEAADIGRRNSSLQGLMAAWATIQPTINNLGTWASARANDFFSEMAQEAGKSIGGKLPHIVVGGSAIWFLGHKANTLIEVVHYLAVQLNQ